MTALGLSGLGWWTSDAEVEKVCASHSDVKSVEISSIPTSGKSTGRAVVRFANNASIADVRDALAPETFPGQRVSATVLQNDGAASRFLETGSAEEAPRPEPPRPSPQVPDRAPQFPLPPQMPAALKPPGFAARPFPFPGAPVPPHMFPPGMPPPPPGFLPPGLPGMPPAVPPGIMHMMWPPGTRPPMPMPPTGMDAKAVVASVAAALPAKDSKMENVASLQSNPRGVEEASKMDDASKNLESTIKREKTMEREGGENVAKNAQREEIVEKRIRNEGTKSFERKPESSPSASPHSPRDSERWRTASRSYRSTRSREETPERDRIREDEYRRSRSYEKSRTRTRSRSRSPERSRRRSRSRSASYTHRRRSISSSRSRSRTPDGRRTKRRRDDHYDSEVDAYYARKDYDDRDRDYVRDRDRDRTHDRERDRHRERERDLSRERERKRERDREIERERERDRLRDANGKDGTGTRRRRRGGRNRRKANGAWNGTNGSGDNGAAAAHGGGSQADDGGAARKRTRTGRR